MQLSQGNILILFQSEFNVTIPGMYSIIFTAFDKAGNYKSTRSVFLFDDQSVVETTSGTRMIVTESTSETNYTWVVTDTSQLHVKWPGRFINERHVVNGWLEPVANHTSIETVYDDIFGRRTVQWYTNIKGIIFMLTIFRHFRSKKMYQIINILIETAFDNLLVLFRKLEKKTNI